MPIYRQYLRATQQLIEKNRQGRNLYHVTILGKKFLASSQVFSPRHFKDTEIFAKHLPVRPGEDFCEIGCGIGVISIFAANKGTRKNIAIDINPKAVDICRHNVRLHEVGRAINVRKGDLFQSLRPDELFDSIFWNTPFGFVRTRRKLCMLERAVFDPFYRGTERFINEGPKHLKPGGRLLIGFSSTLGKAELLEKFCNKAGLKLVLVFREESKEILPVKFEIFEARK